MMQPGVRLARTVEARIKEYRKQAQQTRQDADLTRSRQHREQVLEIADQYDELADSLEQARSG